MYAEYSKAPKNCMSKIDTKIIVHNTQSPIVILEACQNYKSVVIDTLIRCVLHSTTTQFTATRLFSTTPKNVGDSNASKRIKKTSHPICLVPINYLVR